MHHYRPDIDGLRAVAIVPVVLFHAGLSVVPGGFVGVDVFFVISGFLITRLIREDIDAGCFSLAGFYERRVRRLFPALFAMLLATSAVAAWLMLPRDLEDFGKSVLATSLFASNFLFWQEAGYFGRAAEEMPLLHTWSLAVEEQFYILFPLYLAFVAARLRGRYVAATAVVTAATFALSVWLVHADRDAAFYLAPSRAWELGLGALLALGAIPTSQRRHVRSLVAALGAACIAWSVLRYSAATPFPGAAALLPCVGTAAIIWAGSGGHNVVGDALSSRPLVLIGLVSYSLYLWHWPMLALGRYYAVRELTAVETTAVLTLSALAAVASWRWIERPFRGKSGRLERRQLFAATAAAVTGFVAFGLAALAAAGWPQRLDGAVNRVLDAGAEHRPRDWACGQATAAMVAQGRLCSLGDPGAAQASFVLWGDSHGRVLADALDAAGRRAGRRGLLAVDPGCAPLPGTWRSDRDRGETCVRFNDAVLRSLAAAPQVTDVVLAGRWALLAEGERYGVEPGGNVLLHAEDSATRSPAENRQLFERSLRDAVQRLTAQGKRVWIVASVPEIGWNVPSTLGRAMRFGRQPPEPPSRSAYELRQAFVLDLLGRLEAPPQVTVLRPAEVLCAGARCSATEDGLPLYFDSHHLTRRGSAKLEPLLARIFAP